MKINNVRTEYLVNPIGLGNNNPRILWTLEDVSKQSAFEVLYTVSGKEYTTGIIKSNSMYYDFKDNFNSRDYVEFTIKVFNESDEFVLSDKNFFEIGLLDKSDWEASWITGNYKVNKNKRYPVDYFRKKFNVKNIKKARLYISACGLYEALINDVKVGNGCLTPGTTDYNKRIQYQTYDITCYLKNGENVLNILLADGWYRGSIGAKGFTNVFGTVSKVICQLEIIDEFGFSYICSDNSFDWCNDGKLRFADLKDGEVFDNRLKPSYSKKSKAIKCDYNLWASDNVLVEEHETYKPIKKFISPSGKTILEFPNNIAGYISFEVDAHKDDYLNIVLGELLMDGEVSLKNVQCIRKGKFTPLQEIKYICDEGKNRYHTKFFYGGFKYISIESNIDIKINDFNQIALYSSIKESSSFNCSNELINIFYENTLRSLKSNSVDIPTDCPTRERMGWTGDSQLFFESASFITDYSAFTKKHIVDVFDRQNKNGRLPQIAPYSAEDWFMNVMNGSVGWADVGILTPYRFYKKYNDKRLLEIYYDQMVKYAHFMIKRCGPAKGIYSVYAKPLKLSKENRKYGVNTGQSYGEWAEPNDVKEVVWTDFAEPHPEESMAYTIWMMRLMVEISNILGKTKDIELFKEYELGVSKAYQELVTKPRFSIDTNRQCKLVRPLYLHLLTKEQEEFAKERLIKALDFYNWRLGTGFLSTPFILEVLSNIDSKYAYKLLENEEMPGWLYMAKNNTGTIWEGWEGPNAQLGISSLNHYSKGALVEWLFNGMCGIKLDNDNNIIIKPIVGGNIYNASCSYDSIYGTIKSSWERRDGKVIFNISIPSNTTCKFLYKDDEKIINSGDYSFEYSFE